MLNLLTPLSPYTDTVLFVVRVIVGATMMYYGWPKLKDMQANATWFSSIGFKPGWLFGSLAILTEFFGGLLIIAGWLVWLPAIGFGAQMILGTIWKITKADKPFTDWSYDLLLLATLLALLAFGPGRFVLGF